MRNQTTPPAAEATKLFQGLVSTGGSCDLDSAAALIARFRASSPDGGAQLDRMMLEEVWCTRAGLESARAAQEEIRELVSTITAPPHFPAVFVSPTGNAPNENAVVRAGSDVRTVSFGENDPGDFQPGDDVLLSHERNFIVSKTGSMTGNCGETALFVRSVDAGRLVVKSREEEIVVLAAAPLRGALLKTGDLLRFDRNAWVAYEKIERPRGDEYFLEETPSDSFASVGGLDREIEELKRLIELHFYHPETVRQYRLRRKKSVLLYGPPGTGKTLLARALANFVAALSKSGRCRFINVKPGGLHSMWYGQTEANYREVFRIAREAGVSEPEVPVIIFLDEIDSISSERGHSVHQIDDRVANAFMAELNGLEDRGNIIVVCATNRLGCLDSAFTRAGRLGDLILRIPRPGRKAARQIFEKHLPCEIPWAQNGHPPEQTRQDAIDTAISMIFSPNGSGELARLMFRDGKTREIRPGDLINGAEIAAIAQSATERACSRHASEGEAGIQTVDVVNAVTDFLQSAANVLTHANCRNYIDGLPQDIDVVRVEKVERRVSRPHHYLNSVA